MAVPSAKRTIPRLFEYSVARFGENVLLREKRGGIYRGVTYKQVRQLVLRCAGGFHGLGIQKGDRIALLSEGRNDWVVAELGMLYADAVNVPLLVKIEEGFTEQNHMLNSTLKIVRARVAERFRGRIAPLYTPEGKDLLNPLNSAVTAKCRVNP